MRKPKHTRKVPTVPGRHRTPVASLATFGKRQPVYIATSPLAVRFAGLTSIHQDIGRASEMVARAQSETDHLLVSALWHAGAAIYARCFVSADDGMPKLERDHLIGLEPKLRELHEFLLDARHKYLSHAGVSNLEWSSAHVVLCDPSVEKGIATIMVGRTLRSVPPPEELRAFSELLTAVGKNVMASVLKAHARLKKELADMNLDDLYTRATDFPSR